MPTLLKCFECGGMVSSHASQCPRCTTNYPFGVSCVVCCQKLKRSEAYKKSKEYGGAENKVEVKFFHQTCYQQVSQIRVGRSRITCHVCKSPMEFDTSSTVSCYNCGQEIRTHLQDPSFGPCCYCSLPLNKSLEVAVKEVNRQFLDGVTRETIYSHKVCFTKERQVKERGLQMRSQQEMQQARNKHKENIRNQRTEKNIETIALSIFFGLAMGIIVGVLGGVAAYFTIGFGSSWQNAALLGFGGVSLVTVVVVWIFSFFE
jgi:hypothetical protein